MDIKCKMEENGVSQRLLIGLFTVLAVGFRGWGLGFEAQGS